MLQALRNRLTGWVAVVVVAIFAIPMLFFGLDSYFQFQTPTYVAKVGDTEISSDQFRERWLDYTREMRRMLGDSYAAEQFETPVAKRQILERMIDEQVLYDYAQSAGVMVSDARLFEEISKIDAFRNNGVFDPDQYRLRLQANNLTPQGFESRMRRDLTGSFVPRKIADSAFVTDTEVDRILALENQVRDFRFLRVPALPTSEQAPDEPALETFYQTSLDRYRSDESVDVEYIEINAANVEPAADPDEAALRSRYDAVPERFVSPEQRLTSHLLVRVAADADAATVKAGQEKAAALAARVRGGEEFANVARAESDDSGSKAEGGDLGWVEKGMMAPAFETALFDLTDGAVSDPVKTDEGFHLIELRELRPGSERSFADVREELLDEARATARQTAYSTLLGRVIDQVLNDPSNITAAADLAGVPVQRSGPFSRLGATGILALPAVQRQVFSDLAIANRAISDPVELAQNHVLLMRVADHAPSAPRPLAEVRERVIQDLKIDQAAKASEARAEALKARLAAGETIESLAAEIGASVESASDVTRRSLNVDTPALAEAFKVSAPALAQKSQALARASDGSQLLIELIRAVDGDPAKADAAQRDATRAALAAAVSNDQTQAFVAALRAETEVRIVEERLR